MILRGTEEAEEVDEELVEEFDVVLDPQALKLRTIGKAKMRAMDLFMFLCPLRVSVNTRTISEWHVSNQAPPMPTFSARSAKFAGIEQNLRIFLPIRQSYPGIGDHKYPWFPELIRAQPSLESASHFPQSESS